MPRVTWMIVGTLAALVIAALLGAYFAVRSITETIEGVLGPQGEAAEIRVRLTRIELTDVRIGAPRGWPAEHVLRAKRVVITPNPLRYFSERLEVMRIDVEDGYLSAARGRGGGGFRVLPNFAGRDRKEGERDSARPATIHEIALSGITLEIFDAMAGGKPRKVRIEDVEGSLEDLRVPELDTRTRVDLKGRVKGPNRNGTLSVKGAVEVRERSAELTTRARDVDLMLFESYVARGAGSEIESGRFDLDLQSRVRKQRIQASGTLTIEALKLKPSESFVAALAALPRRAALAKLEDEQGRIALPFEIAGELDAPRITPVVDNAQQGPSLLKVFGMSFEGIANVFFGFVNGLAGSFRALVPG